MPSIWIHSQKLFFESQGLVLENVACGIEEMWISCRDADLGSWRSRLLFINGLSAFNFNHHFFCRIPASNGQPVSQCAHNQFLRRMDDLRTPGPNACECKYPPFIDILDPDKNPFKIVLCPKLEEIVVYVNHLDQSRINELLNLAEGPASRGAKLSD